MKLAEIVEKVAGKVIVEGEVSVQYAYASDLLSDVMGHCGDESALITIQNHLNTIAVCTLAGIEVIVICHGRPVPEDMKLAAEREGVAIVVTEMSQFQASIALGELQPSVK